MAQNGAQSAGEGEPLFLVHRNLRDAVDLVFHWIFNGDDLVFVGLDLIQGRVERGGLAAAGGAGDQHHAVGFQNVAAELAQIFFIKADNVEHQVLELLAHRFFIQHAQHGVFAVNGGHDGDAEIDQTAAVLHTETSVLGHAALGDVQLAHDFYARNDGGVVLLGHGLHGRLQHAIDAVLHHHGIALGLNVDIAGTLLQRGKNRGVHQADDRADVGFSRAGDAVNSNVFAGALVIADDVQHKAFAGFLQHALRLLSLFQNVADLGQRGHLGPDAPVQQQADFIDHHQLAGIGNGDRQRAVILLQRNKVVAKHQAPRHVFKYPRARVALMSRYNFVPL